MLPKSGQAEICALDKLLKYVIGDSDLGNSRIASTWRVCGGVRPCVCVVGQKSGAGSCVPRVVCDGV